MAVSILLNFSQNVEFSKSDPLMGLIAEENKLQYYQSLSVERFPFDHKDQYIEKKAKKMLNILENRSLSTFDRNETIRLILVFDFNYWDILENEIGGEPHLECSLPSLKVKYVISMINKIFGDKNPIIGRLQYDCIFVNGNQEHSDYFKKIMLFGYGCSRDENKWISKDLLELNKNKISVRDFDATTLLSDSHLSNQYGTFHDSLERIVTVVSEKLAPLGLKDEFVELVDERIKEISTFGAHVAFNYDDALKDIITDLIGLASNRFEKCRYFMLDIQAVPASLKIQGEMQLKTLVQMLCTIDDREHQLNFQRNRIYYLQDVQINEEALSELYSSTKQMVIKLDDYVWNKSQTVEYCSFSIPESNPVNSLSEGNEQSNQERSDLLNSFVNICKIPFFFGIKPGDWSWYFRVMNHLKNMYEFENENSRPVHDNLERISDNALNQSANRCTFGELKKRCEDLKNETITVESPVDYERFQADRKKKLDDFRDVIVELKKEMKKLGFRSCFLWITSLLSLSFTLCYSYHFFCKDCNDKPFWIGICFVAILLIFLISSLLARSKVKSRIQNEFSRIQLIISDIIQLENKYLDSVAKLDKQMKNADAHRKTLAEVQKKVNEFDGHNKQIEIWKQYFNEMRSQLEVLKRNIGIAKSGNDIVDVYFGDCFWESYPLIPYSVRTCYSDMKPKIIICSTNLEKDLNGVTCFGRVMQFSMIDRM